MLRKFVSFDGSLSRSHYALYALSQHNKVWKPDIFLVKHGSHKVSEGIICQLHCLRLRSGRPEQTIFPCHRSSVSPNILTFRQVFCSWNRNT